MDMAGIHWQDALLRLVIAFVLGTLIGLEREWHQRPAGLRTHLLVCMASALFAMISVAAAGTQNDPGRIAAQVVTGIGFLGAGTIMRHGSTVRGLTTAASLWMASAIGLSVGFSWYAAAVMATVLSLIALTTIRLLEERIPHEGRIIHLLITAQRGQDPVACIVDTLGQMAVGVQVLKFGEETVAEGLQFVATLRLPQTLDRQVLVNTLAGLDGVAEVSPGQ
jgi:putative Mg2+ transporter-C (MgtC) family protein